jgi:2-succinyl-6-hydroxy-2,4-cyclohexadiene-1-carboxylate synthase
MGLHVERLGSGPVVALAHGFTQTGRSWGAVATAVAADHEVRLVDLPGHGASADVRADLPGSADLLVAAAGPATLVGYSMGARVCLLAAQAHPASVRGVVLLGGTAGIDDDGERAARRANDAELGERLAADGVDAFLDGWLAQPLFARLPRDAADLADRRRNTVAGLRASLELTGTGTQEPTWDRLGELAMPVLTVAGADDAKFSALARRMADAIGDNATLALVPDAGHAAHLEQPQAFTALLQAWLAEQGL